MFFAQRILKKKMLSETRSSTQVPKLPAVIPRSPAPLAGGAGFDVETARDALEDSAAGLTGSLESPISSASPLAIPSASLDRASPRMQGDF